MATVPADYLERVYAGVLGKLIGVYVGPAIRRVDLPAHNERARTDRILRP